MKPTPLKGLNYQDKILQGSYDSSIPTPESILGFEVGKMTATPAQIVDLVTSWDKASAKMKLVEYARSHENRPLYYALISTAENLAKIDQYKKQINRLAHPAGLSDSQAKKIISDLPAISWMAYSIHGNETSGSDASIAAIYHLIASKNQDIHDLLKSSIIIIDPSMNPDGRARFTKTMQQSRSVAPSIDDQSIIHNGYWPYGRTNHYLFDLNRDFILGVQPESVGRVKAINEWYPQLMIDGHEMGSQETFLMGPPTDPLNEHISKASMKWGNVFANDQAAAFDQKNWPYYTGEWFENLYPGYSNYAEYRGSVHILYEQARMAEDGVRQGNGRILTYQESVHHQFLSTLTNLKTLATHSKEIYKDFFNERRDNISLTSEYANISYILPPTKNIKRMRGFIRLMELQGFELFTTTKEMSFANATNQLGDKVTAKLPKGSLVIRNRQPEARLVAAILEFDAKIKDSVLIEERQKVLRDRSSVMYDTTAWNLTMMRGVEAFTVPSYINSNLSPYQETPKAPAIVKKKGSIAYFVDGADDASVAMAARLMEQGVKVRVLDIKGELDGRTFSRGTVVVNRYDNELYSGDLDGVIEATAQELNVTAIAISSGLGKDELPDIGGSHFELLEQPQIAILARGNVNSYDFGTIWHSIDSNLGIRHSHLDIQTFTYNDLRRYNTIIIPDLAYGNISNSKLAELKTWVEAGGTLIAVDGAVKSFIDPEAKFSSVRSIQETFKDIAEYDLNLQREWLAQQDEFKELEQLWQHTAATKINYPWPDKDPTPNAKMLKKQDDWQARFSPSGAFVAGRSDQKHWLTYGTGKQLPILIFNNPILMSDDSSQAVVRLGVYSPMDKGMWQSVVDTFKDKPVTRKVGWSTIPDEYKLTLRMSGLIWPESSQRMANSAYLTREPKGNGQIILFAAPPVFRGSTMATNRLLLNAIVYGAGLGTHTVVTQ